MIGYADLSDAGARMADVSTDAVDIAFWTRYAANMALEASMDVEATVESQTWRRERVAFSYVADGER